VSRLLTVTATGTFGANMFRMGAVRLVAGTAAAAATIQDGTTNYLLMAAAANLVDNFLPLDRVIGVQFTGTPNLSVLGAGGTLIVEEM
jgi:hypothetical protein